jgi:hypothetical protein
VAFFDQHGSDIAANDADVAGRAGDEDGAVVRSIHGQFRLIPADIEAQPC